MPPAFKTKCFKPNLKLLIKEHRFVKWVLTFLAESRRLADVPNISLCLRSVEKQFKLLPARARQSTACFRKCILGFMHLGYSTAKRQWWLCRSSRSDWIWVMTSSALQSKVTIRLRRSKQVTCCSRIPMGFTTTSKNNPMMTVANTVSPANDRKCESGDSTKRSQKKWAVSLPKPRGIVTSL